MSRLYTLLKQTALSFLCVFCAVSFSNAAASIPSHGDVQDGSVPDFVVFHGRLYRDGAPFTGNANIGMIIYSSASSAPLSSSCYCDESGSRCDVYVPDSITGCIWKSPSIQTSVTQGVFSIPIQIPVPVLSFSGGNNAKKAYEMVSYVNGSTVSLNSGTDSGDYPLLDTFVYAYAAGALEENTELVLSTLSVANGGDIFLNGGEICFYNTRTGTEICQGSPNSVVTNILKSDTYVYASAKSSTAFHTGVNDLTQLDASELAMFITSDRKVGIGTDAPAHMLHLSKKVTGGIEPDFSSEAIYPYFPNGDESSNTDGVRFAGITVSTITKNKDGTGTGGIYLQDNSIRIKAEGSPVDNQLVLKNLNNGTEGKQQVLINANAIGEKAELAVAGTIYSETGFRAGKINIAKNDIYNEIFTGNNDGQEGDEEILYLSTSTNYGSVILGSNVFPNGGKLQVSGGGISADSLDVSGDTVFSAASGAVYFNSENFKATEVDVVELPSAEIYGNLSVMGESSISDPAYTNKENIFTKENVFKKDISILSDSKLVINKNMVVSGGSFVRSTETSAGYLQIGDAATSFSDKNSYLAIKAASGQSGLIEIYGKGGNNQNNIRASLYSGNSDRKTLSVKANATSQIENDSDSQNIYASAFSAGNSLSAYTDFAGTGRLIAVFGEASQSEIASEMGKSGYSGISAFANGAVYADSIRFSGTGDIIKSAYVGEENPKEIHVNSDNNGGTATINALNGSVIFQNSSSRVAAIAPNGNFGIGVISPSQALTVSETAGGFLAGTNAFPSSSIKLKGNNISAKQNLKTVQGGLYTGGTERINSSGAAAASEWQGNVIDVAHGGTGLDSEAIKNGDGIFKGRNVSAIKIEKLNLNDSNEAEGRLKIANGGTGVALSAPAANETGMLAIDSSGNIVRANLKMNSEADDILALAHGGTGADLSPVENRNLLVRSDGDRFGKGKADLSSDDEVSSVLPVKNGGLGKVLSNTGLIYASATREISELVLSVGEPVLGTEGNAPVAMTTDSWVLSNVGKTTEGNIITLSVPQSLYKQDSPEFAGLRFNNAHLTTGVLKTDLSGNISTYTIILGNILNAPLSVENGGTGTGTLSTGPARYLAGEHYIVSGSSQKLNISPEAGEVNGVLLPSNGGTGFGEYGSGDFLVASAGGAFQKMSLSSGQVFIGNSGANPSMSQITSASGRISVASGGGIIDFDLPQAITTDSDVWFRNISIANAAGGFLKTDAEGNAVKQNTIVLPEDVNGRVASANGGLGVYQDLSGKAGLAYNYDTYVGTNVVNLSSEADLSGNLGFGHGGLNNSFSSGHGLIRAGANSAEVSMLNVDYDSGDYDHSTVLRISNGGTGTSLISAGHGVVKSNGETLYKSKLALNPGETEGVLPYNNGGTSLPGYIATSVLYGGSEGIAQLQLPLGSMAISGGGDLRAGRIEGADDSFSADGQSVPGEIKISLAQSMRKDAEPEFQGLSLTGNDFNEGILYAYSGGKLSTATLLITEHASEIGVLPVGKGGTGLSRSNGSAAGPIVNSGTGFYVGKVSVSTSVAGTLPVSNGGTGIPGGGYSQGVLFMGSTGFEIFSLSNGQIIAGRAGASPVPINVNNVSNQTLIMPGAGSLSIGTAQNIHQEAVPEFAGISLTGKNGFIKASGGVIDAHQKILFPSEIKEGDILSPSFGGTGKNSVVPGILRYSEQGNIGIYGNASINLESEVSGGLPVAYGGLGKDFSSSGNGVLVYEDNGFGQNEFFVRPLEFSTYTAGILPVSKGGTGLTSAANNKVLVSNSGGGYDFASLAPFKILGGISSGVPGQIEFAGPGVNAGHKIYSSSIAISVSLPQNLTPEADVTFAGLTLSGKGSDGDKKFLKIVINDSIGTDPLAVGEITPSDVSNGVFEAAKGGTGDGTIQSFRMLYADVSGKLRSFELPNQHLLIGGVDGKPAPVWVVADEDKGLKMNTGGGNVVIEPINNLAYEGIPKFAGLTISSLSNAAKLILGTENEVQANNLVLSASYGGTGRSYLPSQYGIIAANAEGILLSSHTFSSGKLVAGNASALPANFAVSGDSSKGIGVRTINGNQIEVYFTQGDLSVSGSPSFNDVAVSSASDSSLSVRSLNISGSLAITNKLANTGGNITVNELSVQNFAVIPKSLSACKKDDAGTAGQIKYCTKLIHASGYVADNRSIIVIYHDGAWRCLNGVAIGESSLSDDGSASCR